MLLRILRIMLHVNFVVHPRTGKATRDLENMESLVNEECVDNRLQHKVTVKICISIRNGGDHEPTIIY